MPDRPVEGPGYVQRALVRYDSNLKGANVAWGLPHARPTHWTVCGAAVQAAHSTALEQQTGVVPWPTGCGCSGNLNQLAC